ncbi:MAG: LamG-like jellyroll fold domain-containing protein, partial [Woeseia sp.]
PAIFNPAVLNPAIFNPAILNPAVFNPAVMNPAVMNPAVMNPAVLNPAILNPAIFNPAIFNPALLNPAVLNPAIMNPAVLNPAILNPAVLNPAILNPAVLNPAILNPAILNTTPGTAPQQVDVTFAIRNDGNATTAYDLNLSAPQLAGLDYELMVYRLNEIPVTNGCNLTTSAQQQLVFNQRDPLNNAIDGSFYLEPGQEVLVTFRVRPDVDADTPANPVTTFVVDDLSGLVSAQPLNTDPLTQPPADQFGQSAIVVLSTAGGTTIGGGGTPPLNAGPLVIGQQVSVTATGFVRRGDATIFPLDTPDGSGACNASCLLSSAPGLSLVARIGGGPWQFVGAGPTVLTATVAGDLEFGVNDNSFNDNTGAFYVTVSPFTGALPGLVNSWPGDGDATDTVGANNGVLVGGATFGPGVINQSFVFDGIDDYMDIGRPLPESAGTVGFWVRRNGALTAGSDLFLGSVGPNQQRTPSLFVRAGATLLWEFNNVTVQNTGVPLAIGQWYHVAMTWQAAGASTQVQVYVDGTPVDSITAATPTDFQGDVYVGAYNNNFNNAVETPEQFAASSIDELEVYNRALTEAEIQLIYDAGSASQPVSLWRADGDALDSVGGNDGTLVNGAGFAPGRVGQAFSLSNASNQYVLVADDPSLRITNELTMAAWIYPTGNGNPSFGGIILNKEWAYEMVRWDDGTIRWATGNGVNSFNPVSQWVNSGVVAPLNEWTHVVVTYDQGFGRTYINGTEV